MSMPPKLPRCRGYQLRVGPWLFAPRPWSIMVTAILLGLFVSLSHWQWRRGQYKKHLEQTLAAQAVQAPLSLRRFLTQQTQLPLGGRFARVQVRGQFVPGATRLLDNRFYQHRVGFEVLSILQVPGLPKRLLVNRGWVAATPARQPSINVSTPVKPMDFQGKIDTQAGQRMVLKSAVGGLPHPEKIIQTIDFKHLSEGIQAPLYPFVLHLDAGHPAAFQPGWQPVFMKSFKHIGYAVQWAAFALTLLLLFIILNTTRHHDRTTEDANT